MMINQFQSKPIKPCSMKQLLAAILLTSTLACNNSAGDAKKTSNSSSEKEQQSSGDKAEAAGACSKLIFFSKGAEIEATSYNGEGKEISKQITKVLEVRMEDGMTVADVEGTNKGTNDDTKILHYSYKCDGNNIYFDVASLFRTETKNKDMDFESSLISYPLNVKEGENLPDMTGTMNSERNGRKMQMKYHYKDRKVEGKEAVTTPAGTWNCYRISNTIEIDMDIPGMDERAKKMMEAMKEKMKTTAITWLAPDFGIVKMEMYMGGKLTSKNEVTAIKK